MKGIQCITRTNNVKNVHSNTISGNNERGIETKQNEEKHNEKVGIALLVFSLFYCLHCSRENESIELHTALLEY